MCMNNIKIIAVKINYVMICNKPQSLLPRVQIVIQSKTFKVITTNL